MNSLNSLNSLNSSSGFSPENTKCAPCCQYSDGSCFSEESIRKIADSYNTDTDASDDKINTKCSKKKLVHQLEKKMGTKHKKWLTQECVRKLQDLAINKYTFKPKRPKGKHQWLSTSDIHKVLKQYERVYTDFVFYGPVPVDFEEIQTPLSKLNLKRLYENENKSKFGIIYNLDEHYKSGSHWVSSYLDLNRNEFTFFDSYAANPPNRIINFMKKIQKYCKRKLNKDIKIKINKKRFQYANSECGVYSMFFILENLEGKSFEKITNRPISDDIINQNRLTYYTKD